MDIYSLCFSVNIDVTCYYTIIVLMLVVERHKLKRCFFMIVAEIISIVIPSCLFIVLRWRIITQFCVLCGGLYFVCLCIFLFFKFTNEVIVHSWLGKVNIVYIAFSLGYYSQQQNIRTWPNILYECQWLLRVLKKWNLFVVLKKCKSFHITCSNFRPLVYQCQRLLNPI